MEGEEDSWEDMVFLLSCVWKAEESWLMYIEDEAENDSGVEEMGIGEASSLLRLSGSGAVVRSSCSLGGDSVYRLGDLCSGIGGVGARRMQSPRYLGGSREGLLDPGDMN